MSTPLTSHYGPSIDFGACVAGHNLNLLVIRGFAQLEHLAMISAPDVFDKHINPNGTQRELDPKHADSCFQYARGSYNVSPQVDPRSFPEIILNARDRKVVELYQLDDPDYLIDLDAFTSDSEWSDGVVGVRIRISDIEFPQPTVNPQISRVDGNHRLSGLTFDRVISDEYESDSIPVAFALYIGLDTEQEVKLFKDINGEHKGMDVTHLMNTENRLRGEELKKDPRKRHAWLADRLAQDGRAFEGLVFFGGSKVGAKSVYGKVPPVKLNTLAAAVKLQLVKASKVSANYNDDPELVLELLDRYWSAVKQTFPNEWADRSRFILLQTIGLNGFAILGATLLDQGVSDGKVSQKDFELYLQAVKSEVSLEREAWPGVAGAGGGNLVGEALIKAATKDAATKIKIKKDLLPSDLSEGSELD